MSWIAINDNGASMDDGMSGWLHEPIAHASVYITSSVGNSSFITMFGSLQLIPTVSCRIQK